jgi:hypothetical protein
MRQGRWLMAASVAAVAAGFATPALVFAVGTPPSLLTHAISFIRESNTSLPYVWIANTNGSGARQLGPGNQAIVSPNGALVASAKPDLSKAMYIYKVRGRSVVTLNMPGGTVAVPTAWSPDSRYLAVQLMSTSTNGVKGAGLAVVDTTTDTYRIVAHGVVNGASFAVDGSDRLVYGLSGSVDPYASSDLYEVDADGSSPAQITTDGHSLNPIWGAKGIVFDREKLRGKAEAPAYQVWLMNGSKLTQLTNMKISALVDGLVPLAISADGNRIIAQYEGEDTSFAWTIQVSPLRVAQVTVNGKLVQGAGISSNGAWLLVDYGGFEQPADAGTVESVPFGGGSPVRQLTRGAFPSWNF